jgi:hypothetical protein
MDPVAGFLDDGGDDAMNPLAALNEPSESPPIDPPIPAHLEAEKYLDEISNQRSVDPPNSLDKPSRERVDPFATREERRVVERGITHFGSGHGELVRKAVHSLAQTHGLRAVEDAIGVAELRGEKHPVFLSRYLRNELAVAL